MSSGSDCKVYVGNLGNYGSRDELEREFNHYGELVTVWIARNPPGFAFVEFKDPRDARDAVKALDGRTICGARARVELARGRGGRGGGRFNGGGGGGRFGGGGGGRYSGGRGGGNRRYDDNDDYRKRSRSPKRRFSRSRSASREREEENNRSRTGSPHSHSATPPKRYRNERRSNSRSLSREKRSNSREFVRSRSVSPERK